MAVSAVRCSGVPGPLGLASDMEKLLILLATATLLLLGGCGSDVEETAGTPSSVGEKSIP